MTAVQRPDHSQLLIGAELQSEIRRFSNQKLSSYFLDINQPLASAQTLDVVKREQNVKESY